MKVWHIACSKPITLTTERAEGIPRMAAILQLRRQSLSVSLPDVSCEGASLSGSNQNFIPLPLLTSTPSLTNYK